MRNAHVLIAGAGSAGLVCALNLARAGIRVSVFERDATLSEEVRACLFHPPTLDLLDRFGITPALVSQGRVARHTQHRDRREGLIAEFDLSVLADETAYPFRLVCEQWKLTQLLREQLAKYPHAHLHYGSGVEGVRQDACSVQVCVSQGGIAHLVRGDYLIGADGAGSTVRKAVDIQSEGITCPERFLVLSTRFEFAYHFPHLSYVNYVSDPDEWCVLMRVPRLWRVLFPIHTGESDGALLQETRIQQRLRELAPADRPYEVVHSALYKMQQRVARSFRKGRVLLVGDAAHTTHPLGGMGMNGGMQDAFNLSDKLIEILQHQGDEALLGRYDRQRRTVALEYMHISHRRSRKLLEARDPLNRRALHDELRAIAADPVRARAYVRRTSMLEVLERANAIA